MQNIKESAFDLQVLGRKRGKGSFLSRIVSGLLDITIKSSIIDHFKS